MAMRTIQYNSYFQIICKLRHMVFLLLNARRLRALFVGHCCSAYSDTPVFFCSFLIFCNIVLPRIAVHVALSSIRCFRTVSLADRTAGACTVGGSGGADEGCDMRTKFPGNRMKIPKEDEQPLVQVPDRFTEEKV